MQTKLRISEPGDEYEQEADRAAGQVMQMSTPLLQRPTQPVKAAKESIQTKSITRQGSSEVPPIVHEALNSPGQTLDPETRIFMESRFGHDFSNVQIHTDKKAAESAQAIDARAYTVKNHIVFNTGEYVPRRSSGLRLIAHELTHFIQQSRERVNDVRRLQRQGRRESTDPCVAEYSGVGTQLREIHLNLAQNEARIYTRTGSTYSTQSFSGLILGPDTYSIGRNTDWCWMHPIVSKLPGPTGHGLLNFVVYCNRGSGFGFHSNYWRQGGSTVLIPGSQSAGCARIPDPGPTQVRTGSSRQFFDAVQEEDCVRLYERSTWREPTFANCRRHLWCTGGRARSDILVTPQEGNILQAKAKINELGDRHEQEAERIADQVMRMPVLSLQRQPQPEESPTQSVPSNCVANPHGIHLPPIGAVHPLPPRTLLRPCLLTEARVRSSGNWCSDNHPHTGERCYRQIPTRSGFADCPPGDQYCFTPNGCCHSSPDIHSPVDESSPPFPGQCTDHLFCVIQHIGIDYLPSRIRRLLQQAEDEFR
ncbi:MAG: DUF4157 domain-containing protein [Leptolyngbyaceae cyanobacterium RM1_405_57]|nr:DUF4157 domain-containing protein [Leptolyngbyaceae cyanobacterium RM1_405_57]